MTAKKGAGTDPHPEVAEISDLTEGLLPPDRGTDVRDHIADCPLCSDVLTSLTEIRGLLGSLPGPQRMPADVAGRIDAALAAEAHLDTVLPGPRVPRGTSPEGQSGASAERHSGDGDVPRGTSNVTPLHRGRRRRKGLLVAASVAAVVLVGGGIYEAASSGGGDNAGSNSLKKADAGAAADPVAAQVRQLLAQPPSAGARGKIGDSPMLSGPDGTGKAASVPACVLDATERSQAPLASERDLFQGTDSYLVVLPHPGDGSLVDAYVVSASCTDTSPGSVLFQNTYPR